MISTEFSPYFDVAARRKPDVLNIGVPIDTLRPHEDRVYRRRRG